MAKPKHDEMCIWVDAHVPYEKRMTSSGMTFGGKYVKNPRKEVIKDVDIHEKH